MFLLRVAHNASRPVNRVPVEVLAEIFLRNLPPQCEHFGRDGDRVPDSEYVSALTQVCSFWRQVALGTPALCSILPISDKPELAITMAEQHPTKPLRIFFSNKGYVNLPNASAVLVRVISRHAARISGLWTISSYRLLATALGALPDTLPAMKSMRVDLQQMFRGDRDTLTTIHSRLLRLRTPMLEHLHISPISSSILWATQLIRSPGLRHLFILLEEPTDIARSHSLANILDVLGNLTSLESLQIRRWLAPSDPPTLLPNKACLPRLRELKLVGSCNGCINILGNLELSWPLSSLSLSCDDTDEGDIRAEEVFHALESHDELPPEVTLELWAEDCYIEVHYGRPVRRGDSYRRPISLVFPAENEDDHVLAIAEHVVPHIIRSGTTALALEGSYPQYWDRHLDLRGMFERWSTIREVCVTYIEPTISFLRAIQTAERDGHDRSRWILPNLASLEVSQASDEDRIDPSAEHPWFGVLLAEMELRCQAKAEDGVPVFRSLTFRWCDDIPKGGLDALRKMVPRIRVTDDVAAPLQLEEQSVNVLF
ncbi:hypothetical protein PUNSTDRAFT_134946 [Punctularia strigosozonata HHB-11173 SS5]|uniref:uncharacterized protein n=1 Tax=Punctularia strigosozonata (strain HHB-11173) TaxID=741275 RepID=UPI0004417284|nr:uncharacterized protein PUNSTDRAFT_134946 [Punctularia strigosozonata HHB-11173 SS5]EIN08573.1 hypothetical protein PUNSTDRAFT_134946 [Punctularia strigosozonata HHB-11173 SS5]